MYRILHHLWTPRTKRLSDVFVKDVTSTNYYLKMLTELDITKHGLPNYNNWLFKT